MTILEALEEFDRIQEGDTGMIAICCGVPVIMDSSDGRPEMYCVTCGRTVRKLQRDQWTVTNWGTKGIKLR